MPRTLPITRFSTRELATVAVALVVISTVLGADAAASSGKIENRVSVGSLDLGGRSFDEAEAALLQRAAKLVADPVILDVKDPADTITIRADQIAFKPNIAKTLRRAEDVGRSGHVFARMWQRIRAWFAASEIDWAADHDTKALDSIVDGWGKTYDDPISEAGIRYVDGDIVPVSATSATVVDRSKAKRQVLGAFADWPRPDLELPMVRKTAKTDAEDAKKAASEARRLAASSMTLTTPDGELQITPQQVAQLLEAIPVKSETAEDGWVLKVRFSADKVAELIRPLVTEFETKAEDASFSAGDGAVSVIAGVPGKSFDSTATAESMTRGLTSRKASIVFTETAPDFTTEDAEALGIKERVSTFTTKHPCCQPRVTNIHKMADRIDGAIVRPGESFSLNQFIGERTTAKGYVSAPMIYDGEFKDSVGGGVSQFATTLYNAIFFGGYKIQTAKAHSYYISRYPKGREATVSWPLPDLKFRNNSDAGILIKTGYSSTSITVSFYGDNGGLKVSAAAGDPTNFTDPPEKREANPALPPGTERVKASGSQGFDITVTRVITRPDGEVTREKIFTRYKPEPRIIEFGPGTPAPATPAPTGGAETPRPPATPAPAS